VNPELGLSASTLDEDIQMVEKGEENLSTLVVSEFIPTRTLGSYLLLLLLSF
jgi:hypothetical protein